ncbi:V-type proton ATPase subunit G-like [Lineus longissimus]|uniref:V-type proton ATPase subunit G-like n=1 Tax=Lineus longissimus TaxID=88925 RepID=UPI002B4C5D1E
MIFSKMASQSTGIQQLLAAEKKAAEKVAEARKRKARRLKQAKEEAAAEIDAYRLQREKQFKEQEGKVMGSEDDMKQRIDLQMHEKLAELNNNVANNSEKSLERLLALVGQIKPEKHINLRV